MGSHDEEHERILGEWVAAIAETQEGSLRRKCSSLKRGEWLFGLLCLILFIIPMTLSIMNNVIEQVGENIVNFVAILSCIVFALYYLANGIMYERPVELGCLAVSFGLICVVFSGELFSSNYSTIRLVETVLLWLFYIPLLFGTVLLVRLYEASEKYVIRTIFDRVDLKGKVRIAYRCLALCVLDFHMSIVTLLFSAFANMDSAVVISITATTVFCTIAVPLFGYLTVRYERLAMLIMCLVLGMVQPAFSINDIYRACLETDNMVDGTTRTGPFAALRYTMEAIALVVRLVFLYTVFSVYWHSGYGVNTLVFMRRTKAELAQNLNDPSSYSTFEDHTHESTNTASTEKQEEE